ncbi:hypothetical protein DFH06DRAFT_1128821 [Mycena polygramma]|nr:hypothetical protein DFH06DRAFT_1128821 [Mycena polygramma]
MCSARFSSPSAQVSPDPPPTSALFSLPSASTAIAKSSNAHQLPSTSYHQLAVSSSASISTTLQLSPRAPLRLLPGGPPAELSSESNTHIIERFAQSYGELRAEVNMLRAQLRAVPNCDGAVGGARAAAGDRVPKSLTTSHSQFQFQSHISYQAERTKCMLNLTEGADDIEVTVRGLPPRSRNFGVEGWFPSSPGLEFPVQHVRHAAKSQRYSFFPWSKSNVHLAGDGTEPRLRFVCLTTGHFTESWFSVSTAFCTCVVARLGAWKFASFGRIANSRAVELEVIG